MEELPPLLGSVSLLLGRSIPGLLPLAASGPLGLGKWGGNVSGVDPSGVSAEM